MSVIHESFRPGTDYLAVADVAEAKRCTFALVVELSELATKYAGQVESVTETNILITDSSGDPLSAVEPDIQLVPLPDPGEQATNSADVSPSKPPLVDTESRASRNVAVLESEADATSERARVKSKESQGGSSDLLATYLKEIGRYPLLKTLEAEVALAKQIEAGNEAALRLEQTDLTFSERRQLRRQAADGKQASDTFFLANLRLVVSIAKKYPVPQGESVLDLIQEGNIGLLHAIEKYDWRKGFKLSTYATFWIRQSILRHLNQSSLLKLPGDRVGNVPRALREAEGETDNLSPEDSELLLLMTPAYINKPVGDMRGDNEFGDFLSSGLSAEDVAIQAMNTTEFRHVLDTVLEKFDPLDAEVIRLRYCLDDPIHKKLSYSKVGEQLGIAGEAVRKRHVRAMGKLMYLLDKQGWHVVN